MTVDNEAYSKAVDEFLLKAPNIKTNSDMCEILPAPCKALGVGKVFARLRSGYDSSPLLAELAAFRERKLVLYDGGSAEDTRACHIKKASSDGSTAEYYIYPEKGVNWDDEDKRKIEGFAGLLFAFNSYCRSALTADYIAYHDQEIGTYNLSYLLKFSEEKMRAGVIGKYCACCFTLRGFHNIADSFGRPEAARLAKEFVGGVVDILTADEVVCRIDNDNFAIFFFKEHLDPIMEYLSNTAAIYENSGQASASMTATAGYYMLPDDISEPSEIIEGVTAAKNSARNKTKSSYAFYDRKLVQEMANTSQVEEAFPAALINHEFKVYYQPKVSLSDYSLVGAEALCRWIKDGKVVPPADFIPVLEQSDKICRLDFYMLEQVCRDIRRWLDNGQKVVRVSVNLSRRHLGNADLLDTVLNIVDSCKVPHEYIEIELTETTTDVDFAELKKIVFGLQKAGISTAVDDFGIGYSSLNLIRELPWNVLKIDKVFLNSKENDTRNFVMLKSVIALAQSLGIECIAEGVETLEQVKLVKENCCRMAQGFYFDRPLKTEDFEVKLNA